MSEPLASNSSVRRYGAVAAGGFLGAILRYWLGSLFKIPAGGFPTGTFIINLTGSFILGFFLTLIVEKYKVNDLWRLFFATGFVGAYTTFSSFDNEALALYRQNYVGMGLLYSGLSLVLGLVAVTGGLLVARWVAFGRLIPARQAAPGITTQPRADKVVGEGQTVPLAQEERSELAED